MPVLGHRTGLGSDRFIMADKALMAQNIES